MLFLKRTDKVKMSLIVFLFFIATALLCSSEGNAFNRDKADENFNRIKREFYILVNKRMPEFY